MASIYWADRGINEEPMAHADMKYPELHTAWNCYCLKLTSNMSRIILTVG